MNEVYVFLISWYCLSHFSLTAYRFFGISNIVYQQYGITLKQRKRLIYFNIFFTMSRRRWFEYLAAKETHIQVIILTYSQYIKAKFTSSSVIKYKQVNSITL